MECPNSDTEVVRIGKESYTLVVWTAPWISLGGDKSQPLGIVAQLIQTETEDSEPIATLPEIEYHRHSILNIPRRPASRKQITEQKLLKKAEIRVSLSTL
jgi:hypothetical protein